MIRRRINRGCAFTANPWKPAKPLRPRRPSRRVFKRLFECVSGPWRGYKLCLDECGGGITLPLIIAGQCGHYVGGVWKPHA